MQNKVVRKKFNTQALLAPLALVILYVFFAIFGNKFVQPYTLKSILESAYYIGFMAFGVTFVIITGGIDLSIGTVMMCSAIIGGVAFNMWHWPLWLALFLVPLTGLIFGVANGFMIAKLKLPPFIATLGTMMVSRGFGSIISKVQTQNYPTVGSADEWFKKVFLRCEIPWLANLFKDAQGGAGQYIHQLLNPFPIGVIYLIVFFIIAAFVLRQTRFGRYVFAIGSNEEAARLSGVKVDNWKIGAYALCGLFAGLAGIFYAATYTVCTPGTGNGEELNAIAGVVIGGTSMAGGAGTMVGTLIGVFIMSVIKAGLPSMGLQQQWQIFFTGFVVIGAVLLDNLRSKAATKVKIPDKRAGKK